MKTIFDVEQMTGSTSGKGSTSMCSPRAGMCSSAPHVLPNVLPSQAIEAAGKFYPKSTLEHIQREKYEKDKKGLKRGFYRGDQENAPHLLHCVAHVGAAA